MKLKNTILFTTIITIGIAACNTNQTDKKKAELENLYELAIENQDATVAKLSLLQLSLIDSNNMDYQDSLSRIYLGNGNYETGVKYAERVYKAGKADDKLKEAMAQGYQQIGEPEKAEKLISNLLAQTTDKKYLFQQLILYFENSNKQMFDSLSTSILDQVKTDTTMANALVPMPGPVSGVGQQVPIEAATIFMIGNYALERNQDINKGVKYMQMSIQKYDKFEMPRYVLMQLEQMMGGRRR